MPEPSEPTRPRVVGTVPGGGGDLPPFLAALRDDAIGWCRGRSWEVRLPVVLFFAYFLFRSLTEIEYGSFLFNGINLGFHELGHIVFRPFGELLMVAGGTILQCLVPVLVAVYLWFQQRDYFGLAFCWGWLATNCFSAATYAADARGQLNLPLVSPWGQSFGADGNGDWTRILSRLGLIEWDSAISTAWKVAGTGSMLICFALSGWLFWQMQRTRGEPEAPPPDWA